MVDSKEKKRTDEKILGATYIVSFFEEIRNLTEQYSIYKNLMLEIDAKTEAHKKENPQEQNNSDESLAQFEEIEKNSIKQSVQNVRFFAHKVYIHYKILSETINPGKEIDDKIINSYNKLNETFLPKIEIIEEFVIEINKLLVKDVIRNLLENSEQIINNLYQK